MSIASVSNRWLNRLYKILAIMLVLLAVLISAFRLFLPYVENYREDFQNYINRTNETHIAIGSLGMSWQRSGPTLIANRVTLVDTNNVHVYVEHLEVEVDFWATLTKQRLISSNLRLDGALVKLTKDVWDTQAKKENTSTNTNTPLDGFKNISNLFLNRINRFSLVNSEVLVQNNELERHFHINHLNWLNSNERHQAQGNVIFDELSSNNLSLKIDINGQSIDELKGTIYVEANHLDITPWLDSVLAIENDNIKADIGFSTWLKVSDGNIERIQLSLHDNLMSWQENIYDNGVVSQKEHQLTLSAGQLLFVQGKLADSFQLYSTPMLLKFNDEVAQEYIIQMNKKAQDYAVYLSSFDLSLVSKISSLVITSKNTQNLLSGLNINGKASNIFVQKSAKGIESFASFTDVSTNYSQGIPGVENVSGIVSFSEQYLHVDFTAEHGSLDFDEHFVAPIPYDNFNANIDLSIADNGWILNVNDVFLDSDELTLNADVIIDAPAKGDVFMSLLANVTNGDISKAGHYYPINIMSDNLVEYLNGALISGKLTQAQVLIHGPLAQFPFADNSGTFLVDAEIEQSEFKFSKDWAVIKGFNANLNFTNDSMLITGRSGDLVGLDVSGVQAAIDNLLHEQTLTIDTLVKPSSTAYIADLMNQSPLKDSVGHVLDILNIKGDVNGEFHLSLPFDENEDVLAKGLINFVNNKVALQAPQMNFEQVMGQLRFKNDEISINNLSLNWLGLPIALNVRGSDKDDYYDTNIMLKGNWKQSDWLPHLPPSLKKYFDGNLAFEGDLSLFQHHMGGFSYQFEFDSNLESLLVKLPEPYNKLAQTKVPLNIEGNGQLEQSVFNATYGDQLSFFGVLDHDTNHFSRAHIILGNEKMLLPMDGFHITSNLAQANASEWQPLIADIITATSQPLLSESSQTVGNKLEKNAGLFSSPERIRGTIDKLVLLGQDLNDVSFNLLDKRDWWLLELNAKETRSQIKIYPDWLLQGVDINADFLNLTSKVFLPADESTQENNTRSHTNLKSENIFASIPKMKFSCERCQIDNISFGSVNFALSRTSENVIKLESFKAKREQAEFNLSGEWEKADEKSTTTLVGNLSLKNIEYELEQLGYGSIIRDSGGKLDFNLNWQGAPQAFGFKNLNGELQADIDDGYLAEVSDKARIFSILSLQSIVRKLTLDFRDIFSDGMFYKNIEGDYHIKEGVLYTDNTLMNGSAGNLYIKGNTSFVNQTLDYRMSYKPNLTSSLPVLAWIATLNPVVFLAGVAIDQVITSKVVSEVNFELTGDVTAPNFKEVNRKSRDVSVGRSKPPEFVDGSVQTKDVPENTSFKEFKSPSLLEHQYKDELFKEHPGLHND